MILKQQRIQLCRRREALDKTQRAHSSQRIINQLFKEPSFMESQSIAAYLPIKGEIDLRPFLQIAWEKGKSCYLPVIANQQLVFAPYYPHTRLIKNPWGILEPEPIKSCYYLAPQALDIVLLPLVAFDAQGNRMGRGSGYYDRSFAFLLRVPKPAKPYLIGVAYAWQQVEYLLPKVWDVPLDKVITD
jgi:5-formyltetrahydrofolate cyclo-ligase